MHELFLKSQACGLAPQGLRAPGPPRYERLCLCPHDAPPLGDTLSYAESASAHEDQEPPHGVTTTHGAAEAGTWVMSSGLDTARSRARSPGEQARRLAT